MILKKIFFCLIVEFFEDVFFLCHALAASNKCNSENLKKSSGGKDELWPTVSDLVVMQDLDSPVPQV